MDTLKSNVNSGKYTQTIISKHRTNK